MARFNVNAPDGSIIPVDAPDGATEQDAIAFAAATWKPTSTPVQPTTPAPKQAGFLTGLGRGAASLADVTIGGVLPAIAQQVAYPLARMGRSPEAAQAATQRVVGAIDQPFGKAFGVTDTPEYQQEAGRQLLDFIGQNFQKGAKWIADKTGVPQSDVENYLGTASLATPLAKPVAGAVKQAAAPAIERAVIGAKMPFEKQIQARREAASLKDYARGPQIDAAADAQRLGIALNPVDIEPSAGARLTSAIAGEKGVEAITSANKNQVRNVVLADLGLPPTTQLNGDAAFKQARASLSSPYDEVRKLPIQQADDAMIQRLEAIRTDLDVIGAKEYAPAISKIVDDAIAKTQTGLTGETLIKNISVLRERARKTYNNKSATTEALDIADTNLKVAAELESMIDNSISNPKLLSQYRNARQKMAKTYAYEGATDFNTGMVDVNKLARITAKDNAMTGDIAALGRIAGNFPEAFTTKAASPWSKAVSVGRTGAAGTLGGVAGYALGQDYISAAAGSILGALGGKVGESVAANRMASPSYQASLNLRDMRLPVNQLAASMQPIPQNRAVVPYEAPVEVLMPGEGPYQPNFVMQPNQYGPRVSTPGFASGPAQLPAPSAEGTINMLRTEDARRAAMSRTLGQQNEARQAAAEAAARQPTKGGVELQINPLTGTPEVAAGIKGATPATFENFGTSLASAAEKVTSGKMFDMTLAEKAAWKNTRADLAEVSPELAKLSDKDILSRMNDRKLAQETVDKARQKAQMFDDLAKRMESEQARRDAAIKRDQMLDLADMLEDNMRAPRPVSSGGQGPKTREFRRNQLAQDRENKNALRIEINGVGQRK